MHLSPSQLRGCQLIGMVALIVLSGCPSGTKTEPSSARDAKASIEEPTNEARIEQLLSSRKAGEASKLITTLASKDQGRYLCQVKELRQELSAVRECQKAHADHPTDNRVAVSLAKALLRDHRTEDAETVMDLFYVKHRENAEFTRAYVSFYENRRLLGKVSETLESHLTDSIDSQWSRRRLVSVLKDKGRGDLMEKRYKAAIVCFERLLELSPQTHVFRYHLADAYDAVGQKTSAEVERRKARKVGAVPPPPVGTAR